MTEAAFLAALRTLIGNRYFQVEGGFVDFRDLEDVRDQKALKALLAKVTFDVADKGIIVRF